ncbi:chemotaxis protein CheW [Psychromonas ossibalaenae]|uniref:chemotaxis protein CheW n=1 Tax=Psychromonas ossibalaenae TaxID=444922 RepID=UPI00037084EE|nr:chemotaxis protein CheW [Psychromonas ossibalaenae]
MKNNNDEAMESYFTSMLREETPQKVMSETLTDDVHEQLESLRSAVPVLPETLVFSESEKEVETLTAQQLSEAVETNPVQTPRWENLVVENEFQVLFFELAGLTFAVPLTDLGGIHHLDSSLNFLLGKPAWFSGVMTHNQSLFNIVDTAKWINTGSSAETLNYSHYILLGSTGWGLSCEKLLGTETLNSSQVKWRTVEGKRPWLAGMVKEKMCALIHAEELVKLLNSGMNIHGH